jgi:hypothetical protein
MRRTIYVLLFWLFMGYMACLSSFTQNALAAPHVINVHNAVTSSEKTAFNQYAHEEYAAMMELQLDKNVHPSEDRVGKAFQSNFLQNVRASEASSHHSFNFPWPSLKALDISSLWKQQHDKQKKKDVYDYGE